MKLMDWKIKNRYSYPQMEKLWGIRAQKLHFICIGKGCVKLADAHKIVKGTKGEVDYADLLTGDC